MEAMKSLFWLISNQQNPKSLAHRMRLRRINFLRILTTPLPKPLHILDVGGTEAFWERMGFAWDSQYFITILNLEKNASHYRNLTCLAGDARKMPEFRDQSMDLVFSNSVIEHVGSFEDQRQMAHEANRIGKRFFIQTPNWYFPLEPHFLFPGFQFLPLSLKIWLIQHFNLGWHRKETDFKAAKHLAESVRLLNRRELVQLFAGGTLIPEKFLGLTKSRMITKGFQELVP